MAAAYVAEGLAERPATFSCFVRDLPPERGFLVAGGLAEVLTYLDDLRFGDADLEALAGLGQFDDAFLGWLADVRFTGTVRAVPEGRIAFAGEPLLEIDAPVAVAQLLETYVLNVVTTQTTLASKAARFRHAGAGRPVVDFALRRAQGTDAGMKLVRAVGITGLAGTSNVAGGVAYGVPVSGTMAHAFVQAYEDEADAFRAFAGLYRERTVLLVDTYDTDAGVERAIEVAGELRDRGVELRGIRIDSGDLEELSRRARSALDAAGFDGLQVVVSGGLDEHRIAELVAAGAPIDGFGVGTQLAVSADAPVLDSVYKLVAFDGRPVRKTSTGKVTLPGPKQVWRRADGSGDVLGTADQEPPAGTEAPGLLVPVVADGSRTVVAPDADPARAVAQANGWFEHDWGALPDGAKRLTDPTPHPVEVSPELSELAERLDAATP